MPGLFARSYSRLWLRGRAHDVGDDVPQSIKSWFEAEAAADFL
jgi:hypothetical protein